MDNRGRSLWQDELAEGVEAGERERGEEGEEGEVGAAAKLTKSQR